MDHETPEEGRGAEPISRRGMLKRMGAGAAIAWSAPVLTTLESPAFAQTPVCDRCETCLSCPDLGCPGFVSPNCGGPPCDLSTCFCVVTAEDECVCLQSVFGSGPCVTSDTCLPNERCVTIASSDPCCTPDQKQCIPLCGSSQGPRKAGNPAQRV